MDIVTLFSMVFTLIALIVAFVLEGGVVGSLLQPTAAIIVFGGTLGAVGVSFPGKQLKRFPSLLMKAFRTKKDERPTIITQLVEMSQKARREGLLSLEQEANSGKYDDFISTGIHLVSDGMEEEGIRRVLANRITTMEEESEKGIAIFEAAGGFAPTMGVLGTVMGLVQVLGNLSDPGELGAKIAVAFIATLYGVGSANILWLPLANKLKEISSIEVRTKEMITEGILLLRAGGNPEYMKEHLKGYLVDEKESKKEER